MLFYDGCKFFLFYLCSMKLYNLFLRLPIRLPKFWLSAIAIILLLSLTLLPGDKVSPPILLFPHADKLAHALMFGMVCSAIVLDTARQKERLTIALLLLSATVVTILGIAIEFIQLAMGLGRSAELADAIADAIGAFFIPLCLFPIIKKMFDFHRCALSTPKFPSAKTLRKVHDLYFGSFPESERRPWGDLKSRILDPDNDLRIAVVEHSGRFAGFITWWMLGNGVRYVEHFAISPELRGKGIGACAIRQFAEQSHNPVVLEVEPPQISSEAEARIKFYQNNGFTAHYGFPYTQPPYSPTLPAIPLVLMTAMPTGIEKDNPQWPDASQLVELSSCIHRQVYNVNN